MYLTPVLYLREKTYIYKIVLPTLVDERYTNYVRFEIDIISSQYVR